MIDFQRDFRYPRGGISLPVHSAGRRFRLSARGVSVVQQDGQWLLRGSKGAVPIPPGQESVVSWIVDRPGFVEGELAQAFPDIAGPDLANLLDALAGMKVIGRA
jgi:hypothetical protein